MTNAPTTTATAVERYQHGWRSGKPVEDPDKLKRWGWVSARPSEYLVCTRGGQIDRKRSGLGARVFKWPWHAIAIVPTTLQRIEFRADQITRERVGVEVSGIAVFRIAEPLLAFRVLNFTFPEAATEKLAETLREMFVGSARRLIANLSLDECLTRRKETISGFLMDEIAPVVGGEGSPDDTTTKGWGVVIDTIEIQQVRIQSAQVFSHLQAPYRAELAARADSLERDRVLRAQAAALVDLEHQSSARMRDQEAEHERARKQADLALEMRRREAKAREHENELDVAHQRRVAEIEELASNVRTQHQLVAALPEIAKALQARYGDVTYTQIGGDAASSPLGSVPAAFAQLLALAKSFGLELPKRGE